MKRPVFLLFCSDNLLCLTLLRMCQFIDASLHFFLVSRLTGVNLVEHNLHLLVLIAQITVLTLEFIDEHVCDRRYRRIDHRIDFLTDFRLDAL